MPLDSPATVEDLLNYRLARLLSSSGAMIIRLCEGKYGITRREWRLIAMLAACGPMSPSALADRAHIDRARASRNIAELVAKRLAVRAVSPGDKRRATIALTASGKALHDELFPVSANINGLVLSALKPAQLRSFDRALTLLTAKAEQIGRDTPPALKADRRHGGSRRQPVQPKPLPSLL